MDIDRRGREWARWPLVQAPTGDLEVTFDDGTTWHPLERTGDSVRVLVAGPGVDGEQPAGTVVLALGRNVATVRVSASPEILVREAGLITVR